MLTLRFAAGCAASVGGLAICGRLAGCGDNVAVLAKGGGIGWVCLLGDVGRLVAAKPPVAIVGAALGAFILELDDTVEPAAEAGR